MTVVPELVAIKPLKLEFKELSTIKLSTNEFTLGRAMGNSVVICFISLSRKHCIFRRKSDDSWTVEDMSAFGVRLNNEKLSHGCEHKLTHNDIIDLEPTGEFIYKFVYNPVTEESDPPSKKLKKEELCDIMKDAKQMFEDSQCFEVENLEKKMKNAQELQNTSILMKEQLEVEMEQRIKDLNDGFHLQIENLKGEKQVVEKQKAELEKERDARLTEMKSDMDQKITELMDKISKHTETEKELAEENKTLRERLDREREEFLRELRDAAGREELLRQLQDKCRHQEEVIRERQTLEDSLKRETEQLRIAQQQIEARAEAERQLREEKENTEKTLEIVKKQVAEKEIEMNLRADQRVQEEVMRSEHKVTVLKEELDKVKTELECEKIVRLFTSEMSAPCASASLADTVADTTNEGPAMRSQFGELLETELQCTVCADLLIMAVTLNCSHTFCKYCITQWKKKMKNCPICRTAITSECRSLVIDSFIEKMVENLSDEMKEKRQQILKDRDELETQTAKRSAAGSSRGGDGGDDTSASSGEGESDASSASRQTQLEDYYQSDDYDSDQHYYRRYHSRYYRPEYFDYDSGSDLESSDEDQPLTATTIAGADANTGGGSGEHSGAVESGPGAAGSTRRGASRAHTASRARPRQIIAGVPGSYYGGYGRCFNCGAHGHWAPGCPFSH